MKCPESTRQQLLSFARAVRARRDELGISQEELARRASLHRTYVSDVERGARNISVGTLFQLAGALEVEAWRLLELCARSLDNGAQPAERAIVHGAGREIS